MVVNELSVHKRISSCFSIYNSDLRILGIYLYVCSDSMKLDQQHTGEKYLHNYLYVSSNYSLRKNNYASFQVDKKLNLVDVLLMIYLDSTIEMCMEELA